LPSPRQFSILTVVLLYLFFATPSIPQTTVPTPQQPSTVLTQKHPATTSDTNHELERIGNLQKSVDQIHGEIQRFKRYVKILSIVGSVIIFVAGFFGFTYIKNATRRYVNNHIGRHLADAVKQQLPRMLEEARNHAESYLLRISTFLALRAWKEPDAALKEYAWDGNVASLRDQSPSVRRAIIECLYESKKEREAKRAVAWEAASELLTDDATAETLSLYIRLAVAFRRLDEGYAAFERCKSTILADKEASLRASVLLRKRGAIPEALSLVQNYSTDTEPETLVHIAALQRDLGNFDEADDILREAVNRMISSPSTALPDGWHRLPNTFIANCIDRARPEDAIQAAEFVMRSAPGAVEVFTAGRLILLLPPDDPRRIALLLRYNESLKTLAPCNARIRCEVLAHQLEGKVAQAARRMKEAIDARPSTSGGQMSMDVYFEYSTLGRLLIDQNRDDDAIDCLLTAANHSYGGEAKYHLAIAYAKKNEAQDSVRWLRLACQELPRWAALARDELILKQIKEVNEFLASLQRQLVKDLVPNALTLDPPQANGR
jgi:tetratricopeptide (TPR) repeat protein